MIPPRKTILRVEKYQPPLSERRGKLRLDFNENTIGPSPKVIKAIMNTQIESISVYPEYDAFYEKLAKHLNIKKTELIVTNASDEAIKLIMDTYIELGDEIVLPVPTFPMFKIYASISGAKLKNVHYKKDLSFPIDDVLKAISDKTKLVVLVNPNNPTGTLIERNDIIKIIIKAKNSIVLIDEAYVHFSKQSCMGMINKYKNLIIVQTFSKAYGLAGLRIGYLVSSVENIKNIQKACSPYSVNAIAILSAITSLDVLEYLNNYVDEVELSKKLLYSELKKLDIKTYPSYANFILADFGRDSKLIQDRLRDNGILIRDRSSDRLLKGCIRITLGTVKQTKEFIKELGGFLQHNKNP